MWRTKEWKLILYIEGSVRDAAARVDDTKGELYHLTDDPGEWVNRYHDEELSAIRERLKTELLMHLAVAWSKGPMFYDKGGIQPLES
ncbi:hypothetical protein ACE3NQ_03470 [Paenibacillus terreus]|uniref:Uncharacterized protein n=1 Tax=Paenibacillus terreus TaxID=1387834 RepID=A0ABV5B2S7_9BACL